ncbi:MAG: hypothetical protein E2O78_08660 [Caldithrix sp.]|nr:MAG: hypothetical protein E2O78_08660 [Caldithrix sp.]
MAKYKAEKGKSQTKNKRAPVNGEVPLGDVTKRERKDGRTQSPILSMWSRSSERDERPNMLALVFMGHTFQFQEQ